MSYLLHTGISHTLEHRMSRMDEPTLEKFGEGSVLYESRKIQREPRRTCDIDSTVSVRNAYKIGQRSELGDVLRSELGSGSVDKYISGNFENADYGVVEHQGQKMVVVSSQYTELLGRFSRRFSSLDGDIAADEYGTFVDVVRLVGKLMAEATEDSGSQSKYKVMEGLHNAYQTMEKRERKKGNDKKAEAYKTLAEEAKRALVREKRKQEKDEQREEEREAA